MGTPELPLIGASSVIGASLDKTALINGSQLTSSDFEHHKRGLFLVERDHLREPAIGYVACLDIQKTSRESQYERATMGGLYIAPEHRNQGHATRMVQALTDLLFEHNPELVECVANTNQAAESVFRRAGYTPHRNGGHARIPYWLTRTQWQLSQE